LVNDEKEETCLCHKIREELVFLLTSVKCLKRMVVIVDVTGVKSEKAL